MTPSTTNTAARELSDTDLATLLVARCIDTNSERAEFKLHGVTDAGKEVGDWIVTVSTLTQQQGGEQEAGDALPEPFCYLDQDGYRIGSERNSTYFQSLLESSRSGKPRWRDGLTLLYTADALRAYGDARATAALRTKQPAASEGDGRAEPDYWKVGRQVFGAYEDAEAEAINSAAMGYEIVPLYGEPQPADDQEEDAYVIERMGRLLAEISVIVNGPHPANGLWSYHDLPEKVAALTNPSKHAAGEAVATFLPTGSFVFADSGHDGELNCDCFQVRYKGRSYIMPLRWSNDVIKPKSTTPPRHPADDGRDADSYYAEKAREQQDMIVLDKYADIARALGFPCDTWFGDPLASHEAIVSHATKLAALAGREAGEAGLG